MLVHQFSSENPDEMWVMTRAKATVLMRGTGHRKPEMRSYKRALKFGLALLEGESRVSAF